MTLLAWQKGLRSPFTFSILSSVIPSLARGLAHCHRGLALTPKLRLPAEPCMFRNITLSVLYTSTFQAGSSWTSNTIETVPAGLWFWPLFFCYWAVLENFNCKKYRLYEQNCLLNLYDLLKSNLKCETEDCPWCFFRWTQIFETGI